jgi:hypothetical protein
LSVLLHCLACWELIILWGEKGKTKNAPTPRNVPVFVKVHPEVDIHAPGHINHAKLFTNEKSRGTEHAHFEKKVKSQIEGFLGVRFTLTAREVY